MFYRHSFFFCQLFNKSLSEYNSLGHCQTGHEVVSLLEMKEVTGCKLYNNNHNNHNHNHNNNNNNNK